MSRTGVMTTVVLLLRFATHLYFAHRIQPLVRAPWGRRISVGVMGLVALLPLMEWAVSVWLPSWGSIGSLVIQFEGALFLIGCIMHALWRVVMSLPQTTRARIEDAQSHQAHEARGQEPSEPEASTLTRREATTALALAGTYGAPGILLGYGTVVGRLDYRIEELIVPMVGLPKELEGYTLCQISDVHTGPLVGPRELARGFELLKRVRPDLIVVTGDVVDHDARYADMFARMLTDCPARDGHVAIMGNHDHYAGVEEVRTRLRNGGVRVLHNQHWVVQAEAQGGLALVGLDDPMGGHGGGGPDAARALMGLAPDVPRVMLQHRPDLFDALSLHAPLQLSGHTHGGQVSFGVFNPASMLFKYVRGKYQRGTSTLYVNRGFGVVGVPARLDSPPEITKIVLVSA